jgi:regulator of sirC expression with transglutaminase-like and TPR domain
MPMSDVRDQFSQMAARDPIPLARGALLIAKEEYPGLDVDGYLARIADLAREGAPRVNAGADTIEKVHLLSDFLFAQKGFDGNRDQFADPRNSFLNEVLERRRGIPITLAVVYIEVGRQLGLNLFGVGFPAHFLVKAVDERGELIIDPFNGGMILGLDEIRARLNKIYGQPVDLNPAMLKAVGAREILTRMLRNLKNIYASGSDWNRALGTLDRILILDPRAVEEMLERGGLHERLECFGLALADFRAFLAQAPEHPGADVAREAVVRLLRQVSRMN